MQEKLGRIEGKKSLGQHFLNNLAVPGIIADAGDVQKGDTVLEIGPGTGVLTRELLKRGAHVIAVEADIRAIDSLKESFSVEIMAQNIDSPRPGLGGLTLIHGDVKDIDLSALGLRPRAYKLVANIPYYLTGFLFRFFLEHDIQPSVLVFLVQKEVALRIARDKKESLLSLSVKVFGEPRYVKTIKKGNFTPPPKIDSAILAISGISKEKFVAIPQDFFFTVLHTGFKSKRKQLIGNLTDILGREALTHIFSTLGIPLDARGEDVHVDTWLKLAHALYAQITHA